MLYEVITYRAVARAVQSHTHSGDAAWLAQLCISRTGFALIFTAYAAALPLLVPQWNMSASQAGLISYNFV